MLHIQCFPVRILFLKKIFFERVVSQTMTNKQSMLVWTDQGQGSNQAIEDAGALGVCLSDIRHCEDIPLRLKLVQDIRRQRAAAIQVFSNAGQDQSERVEKEAQVYVKGPVPSKSGNWLSSKQKFPFPVSKMFQHVDLTSHRKSGRVSSMELWIWCIEWVGGSAYRNSSFRAIRHSFLKMTPDSLSSE